MASFKYISKLPKAGGGFKYRYSTQHEPGIGLGTIHVTQTSTGQLRRLTLTNNPAFSRTKFTAIWTRGHARWVHRSVTPSSVRRFMSLSKRAQIGGR